MIEVEQKFKVSRSEYDRVLSRLVPLPEARFQRDTVFLVGITSFKQFVPGFPVVRIRQVDDVCTLTLKRATDEDSSIEHETQVNDGIATLSILDELGLHRVTNVEKHRSSGRIGEVSVHLDEVVGLGHFIEFEVVVDNDIAVESAKESIDKLRSSLGISLDQREPRKYDVLIAASMQA